MNSLKSNQRTCVLPSDGRQKEKYKKKKKFFWVIKPLKTAIFFIHFRLFWSAAFWLIRIRNVKCKFDEELKFVEVTSSDDFKLVNKVLEIGKEFTAYIIRWKLTQSKIL